MKNKPNILIISLDSVRSDRLSSYGCPRETTPNLDTFAKEGVVFENAFTAANWTGASLASILTGLYPTVHGYTNRRYYLDPDIISVPTILRHNGYSTICFSNNMYMSDKTGLSQGFDTFLYKGQAESQKNDVAKDNDNGFYKKIRDALPMQTRFLIKDSLDQFNKPRMLTRDDGAYATELAFKKWIKTRNEDRPFFAYIHYQEPHSIYFPPYPYRRRFFSGSVLEEGRYLHFDHMGYFAGHKTFTETEVKHYLELYDGEIAYIDRRLGYIFEILRQNNVMDDTVIFVTSDHGENMGEKGFFWHAFCLYDKLIRVPLIVRFPKWFEADQRSPDLVQTVDIVPTILDGIGVEWLYKEDKQGLSFLNGRSRKAALTETYNPELMIDRWLKRRKDLAKQEFEHYCRDLRAFQTTEHKFIWASDGWHEFFDMQNDPQERDDLYSSQNKHVTECKSALEEWTGTFKPHVADTSYPGFDKETWNKMRELGYA